MKTETKKLDLKKMQISKFTMDKVKGGSASLMCNSVPEELGGIGCHLK